MQKKSSTSGYAEPGHRIYSLNTNQTRGLNTSCSEGGTKRTLVAVLMWHDVSVRVCVCVFACAADVYVYMCVADETSCVCETDSCANSVTSFPRNLLFLNHKDNNKPQKAFFKPVFLTQPNSNEEPSTLLGRH